MRIRRSPLSDPSTFRSHLFFELRVVKLAEGMFSGSFLVRNLGSPSAYDHPPLQMHTPARTSQRWSRQTHHGLGVCIWMHLVNGTGNSPSPGRPTLE